ncbi:MAG: N(4)-(beta-N-acetylglucosaminyl)-L-asparaginase [bacterium]|nr:N(4)-(beta-N-acetylglucosaminyl)-L-asparaginase [bacterium]
MFPKSFNIKDPGFSSSDNTLSRRQFLATVAAAVGSTSLSCADAVAKQDSNQQVPVTTKGAVVIATGYLESVKLVFEKMNTGHAPADAAVAGANLAEVNPDDGSVGLGGLPNEHGVVELDAAVMDGPHHNAGAVAAIRGIMSPSKVAMLVMRRTNHCLLVGEGALQFAKAHGFREENLLTEKSRQMWLEWKENLSDQDQWLPTRKKKHEQAAGPFFGTRLSRMTGTLHISARNASGDFGACTSTSGIAYKIPGRVGDSPLIGDGLYVDNDVGSAGSVGLGEAVILSCGSFAVVERMRAGRSPRQACLDVLERIVDQSRKRGLVDQQKRPVFNVVFYAIAKNGSFGSASIWGGPSYVVADVKGARLEKCAYLFQHS